MRDCNLQFVTNCYNNATVLLGPITKMTVGAYVLSACGADTNNPRRLATAIGLPVDVIALYTQSANRIAFYNRNGEIHRTFFTTRRPRTVVATRNERGVLTPMDPAEVLLRLGGQFGQVADRSVPTGATLTITAATPAEAATLAAALRTLLVEEGVIVRLPNSVVVIGDGMLPKALEVRLAPVDAVGQVPNVSATHAS